MSTALLMRQPIAGVSPPQLSEATIMTVWPSLAATGIGRGLGRLYAIARLAAVYAGASDRPGVDSAGRAAVFLEVSARRCPWACCSSFPRSAGPSNLPTRFAVTC